MGPNERQNRHAQKEAFLSLSESFIRLNEGGEADLAFYLRPAHRSGKLRISLSRVDFGKIGMLVIKALDTPIAQVQNSVCLRIVFTSRKGCAFPKVVKGISQLR